MLFRSRKITEVRHQKNVKVHMLTVAIRIRAANMVQNPSRPDLLAGAVITSEPQAMEVIPPALDLIQAQEVFAAVNSLPHY